jgi:hypothetical protein
LHPVPNVHLVKRGAANNWSLSYPPQAILEEKSLPKEDVLPFSRALRKVFICRRQKRSSGPAHLPLLRA